MAGKPLGPVAFVGARIPPSVTVIQIRNIDINLAEENSARWEQILNDNFYSRTEIRLHVLDVWRVDARIEGAWCYKNTLAITVKLEAHPNDIGGIIFYWPGWIWVSGIWVEIMYPNRFEYCRLCKQAKQAITGDDQRHVIGVCPRQWCLKCARPGHLAYACPNVETTTRNTNESNLSPQPGATAHTNNASTRALHAPDRMRSTVGQVPTTANNVPPQSMVPTDAAVPQLQVRTAAQQVSSVEAPPPYTTNPRRSEMALRPNASHTGNVTLNRQDALLLSTSHLRPSLQRSSAPQGQPPAVASNQAALPPPASPPVARLAAAVSPQAAAAASPPPSSTSVAHHEAAASSSPAQPTVVPAPRSSPPASIAAARPGESGPSEGQAATIIRILDDDAVDWAEETSSVDASGPGDQLASAPAAQSVASIPGGSPPPMPSRLMAASVPLASSPHNGRGNSTAGRGWRASRGQGSGHSSLSSGQSTMDRFFRPAAPASSRCGSATPRATPRPQSGNSLSTTPPRLGSNTASAPSRPRSSSSELVSSVAATVSARTRSAARRGDQN